MESIGNMYLIVHAIRGVLDDLEQAARPAQVAGTAILGSQKPLRPNSSIVGIKTVQLGEDASVPRIPRYARNDCACSVVMPIASPSTWNQSPLSELEGVAPPQGAVSSLSMLVLNGGGVFTTKCAKDEWRQGQAEKSNKLGRRHDGCRVTERGYLFF